MFCSNCGKKNEDEDKFCSRCGESLNGESLNNEEKLLKGDIKRETKKSMVLKLNKKILAIATLIIVLGGFFIFKYVNENKNSPEGVVQTFFDAVYECDVDKLYSIVEPKSRLEMMEENNNNEAQRFLIETKKALIEKFGVYYSEKIIKGLQYEVISENDNKFEVYVYLGKELREEISDELGEEVLEDFFNEYIPVIYRNGKYYITFSEY